MILGISGKTGSGKDLVGKIIQYHLYMAKEVRGRYYPPDVFIDEWDTVDLNEVTNSEIKKFADKIKDIVCLLIGCTREQLESRDFKNKELGEEWWYWCIFKTSQRVSYLDNKEFDKSDLSVNLIKPTVRELLQEIGTDAMRNVIHPNIWVNATFADYQPNGAPYNSLGDVFDDLKLCPSETKMPNWIITDVRFPNEAKAIKDRGGITIRVNRIHNEKLLHDIAIASAPSGVGSRMIEQNKSYNHPSETALDDYEFDYVIDNNGTIEELIVKIKDILIERGVL